MRRKIMYSIGHGSRKIEAFIQLLKEQKIDYLADVRSHPQSRFHPQFNRKALEQSLAQAGIIYVFMGDLLGGRPTDKNCYVNDRIDYELVKQRDFYRLGIGRLKTAYEKNLAVAIMCSERNPCDCHRSRLIGKTLSDEGIELLHIDELDELSEQARVMNKLKNQRKLF